MDKSDKVLNQFGLIPNLENAATIRQLLTEEIENVSKDDHEYMKTLCTQLFAIGVVEDTLLISKAKEIDFDTHCYIDAELLCGAGLEKTQEFLLKQDSAEAKKELDYLNNSLDFTFNKNVLLDFYKRYYNI